MCGSTDYRWESFPVSTGSILDPVQSSKPKKQPIEVQAYVSVPSVSIDQPKVLSSLAVAYNVLSSISTEEIAAVIIDVNTSNLANGVIKGTANNRKFTIRVNGNKINVRYLDSKKTVTVS